MRFSLYLSEHPGEFDCQQCDEKKRRLRNCHNRAGHKEVILEGADEWKKVAPAQRPALKIPWAPTKFMACPVSTISTTTWQVLGLVNECTSAEHTDLLHLPFDGKLLDQPRWFRAAVSIVRDERNAYRSHRMEESRKKTTGKGKR